MVRPSPMSVPRSVWRWPAFFGGKPMKVKARVGRPDATRAAIAAVGPGIGVTV